MTASAVVFGYSEVGVRCLQVLLSAGVDVRLVVTHEDDPNEHRWYGSVAEVARDYAVPCITPPDARDPALLRRLHGLAPDFIFSFYYRSLLGDELLGCARRAALNMHGSLLPKYRGRAPLNWAILHGETETGATLHHMVARADAGDIVDQQAVPILLDDDARIVFGKITVAAEMVLVRSLPRLIDGTAAARAQPILEGQYFGRRRPEDGRIDWGWPAKRMHDLVRAVAPPYPGAFATVAGERWGIHRTRLLVPHDAHLPAGRAPRLVERDGRCIVECSDGRDLQLLAAADARGALDLAALARRLAAAPLALAPGLAR
ncbi:MAG: formyltransferase [Steroidobacteraceae bacterium]